MKPTPKRSQRGAGTLAVTLMLLLVISIVAFYLNRGVLFEQRASGNQTRATLAQEIAEAGIEWATGMLNSPYDIGADCNFHGEYNTPSRASGNRARAAAKSESSPISRYPIFGSSLSAPR